MSQRPNASKTSIPKTYSRSRERLDRQVIQPVLVEMRPKV